MSAAEVDTTTSIEKNALGIEYSAACIIGSRLKDAREDISISKEYVAKKAKIRERYIDAIELGDWDVLPPGLNGRGLVRLYAKELGVHLPEFEGFSNLQTVQAEKQSENLSHNNFSKKSRYQPAAEESAEIIKIVPRSEYKNIHSHLDDGHNHIYPSTRDTYSNSNQSKFHQTKTHHAAAVVTPKISDVIGIEINNFHKDNSDANKEIRMNLNSREESRKHQILPTAKPVNTTKVNEALKEEIDRKNESKNSQHEETSEIENLEKLKLSISNTHSPINNVIAEIQSLENNVAHIQKILEEPTKKSVSEEIISNNTEASPNKQSSLKDKNEPIIEQETISNNQEITQSAPEIYIQKKPEEEKNTIKSQLIKNFIYKYKKHIIYTSSALALSVLTITIVTIFYKHNKPQITNLFSSNFFSSSKQKTEDLNKPKEIVITKEPKKQEVIAAPVLAQQAPILVDRNAKVDILAKVKIQIVADGKEIFSGYQQPGPLEFNFKDKAEILVYDASKVKLSYGSWDHGELGWNERKRKITLNAKPFEE